MGGKRAAEGGDDVEHAHDAEGGAAAELLAEDARWRGRRGRFRQSAMADGERQARESESE